MLPDECAKWCIHFETYPIGCHTLHVNVKKEQTGKFIIMSADKKILIGTFN